MTLTLGLMSNVDLPRAMGPLLSSIHEYPSSFSLALSLSLMRCHSLCPSLPPFLTLRLQKPPATPAAARRSSPQPPLNPPTPSNPRLCANPPLQLQPPANFEP